MSATPIDLSKLPAPELVESLDFETILFELKAKHVSLYPDAQQAEVAQALTLESEPVNITLQGVAYRELVLRQRINDVARQLMLAFAKGGNLEHLAALFEVFRLTIKPADPENNLPAVMESDDDLKERTQLAPQGFSVAGPSGAYVSHARGADGQVLDASAISPAPCEVVVTVLSRAGNGTADTPLLDKVKAALSAKTVRPLTDFLDVRSASIIEYSVRATLVFFEGPDRAVALAAARTSIAAYALTMHKLGQAVTLDGVLAALRVPGVQKVILDSPAADLPCSLQQATYCTGIEVIDGGLYVPAE